MPIPNLNNLIAALKCDNLKSELCKICPYRYQKYDTSGDTSIWTCDDERKIEDALFYLEIYQHLANEVIK